MPLYELVVGESRRFWHAELDGTRIRLHYGLVGTEGQHRVLAYGTVENATEAYERMRDDCCQRGFRLVAEDGPYDPEAIERARLAATRELSTSPRFLFVNRALGRFAWVELLGTEVVTARGPLAEQETTPPTTQRLSSPRDAERLRDAMVNKLVREGYELETFAAQPAPKPRESHTLYEYPDLERAVADDPYNDGVWTVLEDWLLEQDDPRGKLVLLEKEKLRGDEAQTRGTLMALLFGELHEQITSAIVDVRWRAGYLVETRYIEPLRSNPVSTGFFAAPATRLLRRLDLEVFDADRLGFQLALLEDAPSRRSLRRLGLQGNAKGMIDAGMLAGLRLDFMWMGLPELSLDGRVEITARELKLHVSTPAAARTWCEQRFPVLRKLELHVEASLPADLFTPLFDGTMAPALEAVEITTWSRPDAAALRNAFAGSPVMARATIR